MKYIKFLESLGEKSGQMAVCEAAADAYVAFLESLNADTLIALWRTNHPEDRYAPKEEILGKIDAQKDANAKARQGFIRRQQGRERYEERQRKLGEHADRRAAINNKYLRNQITEHYENVVVPSCKRNFKSVPSLAEYATECLQRRYENGVRKWRENGSQGPMPQRHTLAQVFPELGRKEPETRWAGADCKYKIGTPVKFAYGESRGLVGTLVAKEGTEVTVRDNANGELTVGKANDIIPVSREDMNAYYASRDKGKTPFFPGEEVTVTAGYMKGFDGVVHQCNGEMATILVKIFGNDKEFTLPVTELAKA